MVANCLFYFVRTQAVPIPVVICKWYEVNRNEALITIGFLPAKRLCCCGGPWEGFQLITCRGSCMQNSNGIVLLFAVRYGIPHTSHRYMITEQTHLHGWNQHHAKLVRNPHHYDPDTLIAPFTIYQKIIKSLQIEIPSHGRLKIEQNMPFPNSVNAPNWRLYVHNDKHVDCANDLHLSTCGGSFPK